MADAGFEFERLITSARRRLLIQIISSQVLVALSIGAGGLVLLLILGTQVFDWYWPVLLAVASLGYLVWRSRQGWPTPYRVAQLIDYRLNLADLLSTAFHFRSKNDSALQSELVEKAEQVARTTRPEVAFPTGMPTGWGRATATMVLALSLLVFRYAFQSHLDLGEPIAPGLYELLASSEKPKEFAKGKKADPDAMPIDGIGVPDTTQRNPEEKGIEKGQEIDTMAPNSNDSSNNGQKPGQFQQTMSPNEEGEKGENGEKGESGSGEKKSDDAAGGEKKDGGNVPANQKQDPKQQQGNQSGEKSSLMDKFKDAMANLANKMKPQEKNQGQQQAQNQKQKQDQQNGAGQQQQQSQQGQQQQQGKQQAGGQQQNDPNGQQQGEGQEKSPSQQAKGSDKSNQPPNGDSKSGTGKQDGNKNVELAEQQRAMGKISEIFGKRAQNLQGEIMIEVSSSKSQQLKTGYSGKSAQHSDTSGVINRDEVPLIFQNYVQKYFEEIRKSPAPEKAAEKPAEKSPAGK